MRRLALLACAVVAVLAAPAIGRAAEVSLTMDDGVRIDASLVVPDGLAPTGGWPAVMFFHGLGGNHKGFVPGLGPAYLAEGYAVFPSDARGPGKLGGYVSGDGTREVADVRTEFQWLPARPGGSDTQVGAWGISLGGGAAWN